MLFLVCVIEYFDKVESILESIASLFMVNEIVLGKPLLPQDTGDLQSRVCMQFPLSKVLQQSGFAVWIPVLSIRCIAHVHGLIAPRRGV